MSRPGPVNPAPLDRLAAESEVQIPSLRKELDTEPPWNVGQLVLARARPSRWRVALVALAIPALLFVSFFGGHQWQDRPLARLQPVVPQVGPLARPHPPPAVAWDIQAAQSDSFISGVAWAISQNDAFFAPGRKCPPVGDCVLDFPYHDEILLLEHQGNAGRVWIPEEARDEGGAFPVIVLLHGIEPSEAPDPPHKLLSPPLNLSQVVRRHLLERPLGPLLVAAPSQTRDAAGSSTLWTAEGFDLAGFLETLNKELKETTHVQARRDHVFVLGHSGAGCVLTDHKKNGLFRVAEQLAELRKEGILVRLLGLMDTCFFGSGGGEYLAALTEGTSTQVFGMWVEPERWAGMDRDLESFARSLGATRTVPCPADRYVECFGSHEGSRVYKARLEGLSPPTPNGEPNGAKEGLTPHDLLTLWFVDEALGLYIDPSSERPPEAAPSAPAAPTKPGAPKGAASTGR